VLVNGQGRNNGEEERFTERGAPGDGPFQPPDGGTDQHLHGSAPISSDVGSGVP